MSQIVLNLELYEGKDIMSSKDHAQKYGASTASHGRCVIADSRFWSVKCAKELMT